MNEVLILAAKRVVVDKYSPSWIVPHVARDAWQYYLQSQEEKGIEYDRLLIKRPYKPRSTGRFSQNHRINGFIQQVCKSTAMDFDVMKYYFKKKAISRGYPFKTDPEGSAVPDSESTINTIQAGYLIDEIEQFAAENGIYLQEDTLDLL